MLHVYKVINMKSVKLTPRMARTALWIRDFESIFFRELRRDLGVSESFVALVLGKQLLHSLPCWNPASLTSSSSSGLEHMAAVIY